MRLIQGQGVSEDPRWESARTTFDGRSWANVPGSGGIPTRIVVNRLYEGHGSLNLVLHEVAHSLESLASPSVTSKSAEWKKIVALPAFTSFLKTACGEYCVKHPNEAFAEVFAWNYACDASREQLARDAPEAVTYLKAFTASFSD